jgi:hypothetical protein
MTERELILLGFKSEEMREHDEDESYYYVLDIVDGLTFITPPNDEIKEPHSPHDKNYERYQIQKMIKRIFF